jgi:Holliday junction resolvase RusA-like endonuclease
MDIFQRPQGLTEISHFKLANVQTWGTSVKDGLYKELIRSTANLSPDIANSYSFYVFSIKSVIGNRRRRKVGPDVENIPKLIVDAFTGTLYPDDNLDYVRGIQVEAVFGPDNEECTEVWIYGYKAQDSV